MTNRNHKLSFNSGLCSPTDRHEVDIKNGKLSLPSILQGLTTLNISGGRSIYNYGICEPAKPFPNSLGKICKLFGMGDIGKTNAHEVTFYLI
jgi:hypothetical protein